jgi:hypothetical protein
MKKAEFQGWMRDYFGHRVEGGWKGMNRFYTMTGPLHAFKAAMTYKVANDSVSGTPGAIVNIVVPEMAEIYVPKYEDWFNPDNIKMRASEAFIFSIYTKTTRLERKTARSWYDSQFKYVKGEYVKPVFPMSRSKVQCTSGIHFFLSVDGAMNW